MAHSDKLKPSFFPQIPISLPPTKLTLPNFPSQAAISQLSSIQSLLGKRDLLLSPFSQELPIDKKIKIEQQLEDFPRNLSSLTRQDTDVFVPNLGDSNILNTTMRHNQAHQDYMRLQNLQQAQYLKLLTSLNNQAHVQNSSFILPKIGMNADTIIPSQLINSVINKMPNLDLVYKVEDVHKQVSQVKASDLIRPKFNEDQRVPRKEKKSGLKSNENLEHGPVLAEFTREYPDWDLCTIFEFLKSGKSRGQFESERKTRLKNKSRKERKWASLIERKSGRNGIEVKK